MNRGNCGSSGTYVSGRRFEIDNRRDLVKYDEKARAIERDVITVPREQLIPFSKVMKNTISITNSDYPANEKFHIICSFVGNPASTGYQIQVAGAKV